jgi:hypothetical protein
MAAIPGYRNAARRPFRVPPSCDKLAARHHRFVNGFIMLPNSGQARAKLEWE